MSVIALRTDNKTYIACDSLVDEYNVKYISRCEENQSIFPAKGAKNVLMGHIGSDRECDLLKTVQLIPSEYKDADIDYALVVTVIVPAIFDALEKAKYLEKEPFGSLRRFGSRLILATPKKIFVINNDGAVTAFDEYAAIGMGGADVILMGGLSSNKEKEPKERILDSFLSLSRRGLTSSYPVVISDTDTMKFEVIEKR